MVEDPTGKEEEKRISEYECDDEADSIAIIVAILAIVAVISYALVYFYASQTPQ